jgi:hypothetical protein
MEVTAVVHILRVAKLKTTYDHNTSTRTIQVTDKFMQDNPAFAKVLQDLQQREKMRSGAMGKGASYRPGLGSPVAATASGLSPAAQAGLFGASINPPVYGTSLRNSAFDPAYCANLPAAIKEDIAKQGAPAQDIDQNRVARAALRALRDAPDDVFEETGANPKYVKENFIKVIDKIMNGM